MLLTGCAGSTHLTATPSAQAGLTASCTRTNPPAVRSDAVPRRVALAVGNQGGPVLIIGHGDLWTLQSALAVPAMRNLDGSGTFRGSVHTIGYPYTGFAPSALTFSSPGCWQITVHLGSSSTLMFALHVHT